MRQMGASVTSEGRQPIQNALNFLATMEQNGATDSNTFKAGCREGAVDDGGC